MDKPITLTNMKPTPQHIIQSTIGREYTKPKLNKPHFEDAPKPPVKFGFLGEILGKLSKENK